MSCDLILLPVYFSTHSTNPLHSRRLCARGHTVTFLPQRVPVSEIALVFSNQCWCPPNRRSVYPAPRADRRSLKITPSRWCLFRLVRQLLSQETGHWLHSRGAPAWPRSQAGCPFASCREGWECTAGREREEYRSGCALPLGSLAHGEIGDAQPASAGRSSVGVGGVCLLHRAAVAEVCWGGRGDTASARFQTSAESSRTPVCLGPEP